MTTITSVCLLVGRFSSSSSSSSSPSSSLFLRRRFYRRQRESTNKNENNAGAGVVCNSRRELPKQKQSQQLTKKQREKIEVRKREEREFFRNEVEAARTGVGGARSHGRCLPDEESELFSRETVEDETRLFSTYDDVEVKVDLESLNVNGKNEREEENRAEENGKNAPTTSSPTAIRRLSEASLSTYDEGVVTNARALLKTRITPERVSFVIRDENCRNKSNRNN